MPDIRLNEGNANKHDLPEFEIIIISVFINLNKYKIIIMSNINLIIEERAANIGKFLVGRLLPFRRKRMIGPFIYMDRMGPVSLNPETHFDVPPHPHIGLSTLTYLLEGSIMHRDSLGNEVEIKPGEVNWMTAGKGIVHSERSPDYQRNREGKIHGLQIWVALPAALEQMEPGFAHIEADAIPAWQEDDLHFRLIAGEAMGRQSPVPVYSRLFLMEVTALKSHEIDLSELSFGELGLYILEGGVFHEGQHFGSRQLLVAVDGSLEKLRIEANSKIYILGGETFPEPRFIDWNFVSSKRERIEEAKRKWIARKFDTIKGDEKEYIPYPGQD